MKSRSRQKLRLLVTFLLALPALSLLAQQQIGNSQLHAKAVLHPDGTRTESVKDTTKREMMDSVYDSRGVVISKKVYLLNENGDATQGVIYDGAGNVIARVQFYFDDLGRVIEERCLNTKGEIFRRVIRQYDPSGKSLPPKAFDYQVNAPNMRASTLDFTKNSPATSSTPSSVANPVAEPGQTPQVMTVSPRTGARTPTATKEEPEEKKKRGFFGFGKK